MKKILFAVFAFFLSAQIFSLPNGYSSAKLGMDIDSLKEALKKDHQFGYRGDRDVSLSPSDGQFLIETDGSQFGFSFLGRCWFQFANDKLYIITLNLDRNKVDHYSVFSKLCEKYGNPDELSPKKSVWRDGDVILSLEKPLTLKYTDAKAFDSKKDSSNVEKTTAEKARDKFLDSL
ncbi:MAG: hypothetical protein IJJ71_09690 [Treponema sp.]|uniref:hypothetical protein n=1 Tax=Treponema sp. TaxID=166 RepID=UPI0025CF1420|nr:hypothetical protein [Treponema sp.]MBR0496432.1 hypothetical protein [Treponema sp.]